MVLFAVYIADWSIEEFLFSFDKNIWPFDQHHHHHHQLDVNKIIFNFHLTQILWLIRCQQWTDIHLEENKIKTNFEEYWKQFTNLINGTNGIMVSVGWTLLKNVSNKIPIGIFVPSNPGLMNGSLTNFSFLISLIFTHLAYYFIISHYFHSNTTLNR